MRKVLPYDLPEISHTPGDTYLLAILNNYTETESWLVNNFISINISETSGYDEFTRLDDFYNCPYLVKSGITYEFLDGLEKDIVDIFRQILDKEFYIYVLLNRSVMAAYAARKETMKSMDLNTHNMMVYGYDDLKREFYFGDFYPNISQLRGGVFGHFTCTYDEMRQAYYGQEEFEGFRKNCNVMMLKFKGNVEYSISISDLILQITKFLDSTNIFVGQYGSIAMQCSSMSFACREQYVFGVDYIQYLSKQLMDLSYNRMRTMGLLRDMIVLWQRRIKYLVGNGYIMRKENIINGQLDVLRAKLETAMLLFMKVCMRGNAPDTIKARERIVSILKGVEVDLKAFLTTVKSELIYYQYTVEDFS